MPRRWASRPTLVAVPCSGGGLGAGVGLAVRATPSRIAPWFWSSPRASTTTRRSLAAGTPVANAGQAGSICDALMAAAPGAIGFALNSAAGTRAVAVSDDEALAAVAFAFEELKLVVEPGGAVALAALLVRPARRPRPYGRDRPFGRQCRSADARAGARRG